MKIKRLITLLLAMAMVAAFAVTISAASIYPDPLPEIDWDESMLLSSFTFNEDYGAHVERHVYTMNAKRLKEAYTDVMDTRWQFIYMHGYEPAGEQYMQYRYGERVLPVIEPYYNDDGKLVGEAVHYVPRIEDFYLVSEQFTTNNKYGARAILCYNGEPYYNPGNLDDVEMPTARTYDASGNFEYEKYEYPFEYAYKISVADFAAGYTAADYVAGKAPPSAAPDVTGADEWAKAELSQALTGGLIPDSVAKAGWKNATSRLAAAEAIVAIIEKATGRTMAQIAGENGWDLTKNGFSDTDSIHTTFLKYAGITNGTGDNKYNPNGNYTRAQIVTMIGRAAEVFFGKKSQGENPFTDVPDWAAPYVGYAAANNITNGVGGGRFDSNGVLQNQHTAIFVLRAFNAWM